MSDWLIVGAEGQVGQHLRNAILAKGLPAIGVDLISQDPAKRLDIRQEGDVRNVLTEVRPSVVFLPAGLANVDYCELHPTESYETNVTGVYNVVRWANDVHAQIVFFSSDYLFDGQAGPYDETSPPNPINKYGRQKLMAEHGIALHASHYLIVRTTVVYGWESQGKNFVYRLTSSLKQNQRIDVPADQTGNPTYAPNLAEAVVELVSQGATGVFNVVGPERVSRYEFAREAARVFGMDERLIRPVMTSALGQPARRPLDAGLLTEKASAVLQTPLLGFRDGLRSMARAGSAP
jgi:dTDP-4-dehydrorhamnose reductase